VSVIRLSLKRLCSFFISVFEAFFIATFDRPKLAEKSPLAVVAIAGSRKNFSEFFLNSYIGEQEGFRLASF